MTAKTETLPHAGGFLLSEGPGSISRDEVTLRAGENLKAGTVIAKLQDGNWAQFDPSGSGLADVPAGILFGDVDATSALTDGAAITRLAEVKSDMLVWPDGISDGDKATAIASLADNQIIIVRDGPATFQVGPSS